MRTMWKFALTLLLALITASGATLAAGNRGFDGSRDSSGWSRSEQRGWQRDGGRVRSGGARRESPRARNGDRRRGGAWDRPWGLQIERAQNERRYQRDPRYNRDQRNDRRPRIDRRRGRNADPRSYRDRRRYNPDQGGRNRARDAVREGRIMSPDQVMAVVQRRYRGRVLNVHFDDRRMVYYLRVLTRQGRVLRIAVNARNARVLSVTGGR